MEDFPIAIGLNFTIEDQVIGKEFSAGLDILMGVIDEDKEQD